MNSPHNAAVLRSLIVYAICVPLAIVIGYMLTNPMDYSTYGMFGVLALLIASPLLLRWHYELLFLSWNLGISTFFIPGQPPLWLVMVMLSLGIAVLGRTLNSEMHFIRVPQITWPLLCLAGVALITAKFTGGIGLHAFGSDVYGGKKYFFLLGGILSYFAFTSRRVPPERAGLYLALFYLGSVACIIQDLYPITPSFARFIFWLYPPNSSSFNAFEVGVTRLAGFSWAGTQIFCFLMARYGVRGVFLSGKPWRLFVFFLCFTMIFLGGFRFQLFMFGAIFAFLFFLEGLHRTRLLPLFAWFGIMAAVALVPLASKLPFTFQRTLTFLPLQLSTAARAEAEDSTEWRVNMWKGLLPQVPQYLLLGKGLGIKPSDFNEMMGTGSVLGAAASKFDPGEDPLALSYDYHNGPLSVIIPFGIWGCIVVLWFLAAGLRVTYRNFKHGDPVLQTINTFLFVDFAIHTFQFLFMGGALTGDTATFASILGLSVAFNGGVCQPAPQPVPTRQAFPGPRGGLPGSRPRPAFTR